MSQAICKSADRSGRYSGKELFGAMTKDSPVFLLPLWDLNELLFAGPRVVAYLKEMGWSISTCWKFSMSQLDAPFVVFFVPSDRFDDFQKQSYLKDDGRVHQRLGKVGDCIQISVCSICATWRLTYFAVRVAGFQRGVCPCPEKSSSIQLLVFTSAMCARII